MADATLYQSLLHLRWEVALERNAQGAPLISPRFVAHQGPGVQVVDLRPVTEACGVLGYIPGSAFVGADRVTDAVRELPDDLPVVFVSRTGAEAAGAALRVERGGRRYTAAMIDGLAGWRRYGFATSRDPSGVSDALRPVKRAAPAGGRISLEQLRDHVVDPRAVRWVKLATLGTYTSLSCIDGRDERGLIGAPGGDAGEFLLSLAAVEAVTGTAFDEDAVSQALLARVDTFGGFLMHTDAHAFDRLVAALRGDRRIGGAAGGSVAESFEFLRRPPRDLRDPLLEHLVDPAHVGCGHVRLMLQRPDAYGIRRDLITAFFRSFFRLWWAGSPELDLTILSGEHAEAAVVNVRLDDELWGLSRIPLVSPTCAGIQMFVNHPDVARYLRRGIVQLYRRGLGPVPVPDGGRLQAGLDELAARQLAQTVGALANDLPVYDLVFAPDGSHEVRENAP
jgi:rhodanese-related sulfurtransferase